MAALIPLMAPWVTNDRGISVGQNDAHRNSSAPTDPANRGRPRIVRRTGASAESGSAGSGSTEESSLVELVSVVSENVAAMGVDTTWAPSTGCSHGDAAGEVDPAPAERGAGAGQPPQPPIV